MSQGEMHCLRSYFACTFPDSGTGSRDVFVVRTSNPPKTSEKMGYFDHVSVSLHILYTANQDTEGSQDRLTVENTEREETNLGPIFEFERDKVGSSSTPCP